MTFADIARAQTTPGLGPPLVALLDQLLPVAKPKPSRFPPELANHPAFTRRFNARLVAIGMAATNGHRRLGR